MKIIVANLGESARIAELKAQFGRPIDREITVGLRSNGLAGACARAEGCLGWIWRQWLLGTSKDTISGYVEPFVERGLELRRQSSSYHKLALHDLYLLHCAIFASSSQQLEKVVENVADASGDKGQTPADNGELYASAWCGMMKYWILGDPEKAAQQGDLIWGADHGPGLLAAAKFLVTPWLREEWAKFVKAQQKDFEKLWDRAHKDCWTVRSENAHEIVVTTDRYQIEHQWCWAHCGMALLAHRLGVKVATDPFWFPPHVLKVIGPED